MTSPDDASNGLDDRVYRYLRRVGGRSSRRSFLYRAGAVLVGTTAGTAVTTGIIPLRDFGVSDAGAAVGCTHTALCGINGRLCTGCGEQYFDSADCPPDRIRGGYWERCCPENYVEQKPPIRRYYYQDCFSGYRLNNSLLGCRGCGCSDDGPLCRNWPEQGGGTYGQEGRGCYCCTLVRQGALC